MKKLSHKNKRHTLARIRYQLKRKKGKIREHKSSINYNSLYNYKARNRERKKKIFKKNPPENFNLHQPNFLSVISYINSVKKAARRGWDIIIDLKQVKEIREGAITMLLSVLKEISANNRKIDIRGYLPSETNAKEVLDKSGFLKFVRSQSRPPQTRNVLRTGKKGNPSSSLSQDVRTAMNTVWNTAGRNPPLRAAIFEMIRNSCDHAFNNKKEMFWHLSISHDEENNLVKFSFIDNGSGILTTMRKSLKNVLSFFEDDSDILESAFFNGIESRTKLPWRGKGLPAIFDNVEEGYFKNLLVISNKVYIHFDSKTKRNINVNFEGTYYYWEIDQSCVKVCFD